MAARYAGSFKYWPVNRVSDSRTKVESICWASVGNASRSMGRRVPPCSTSGAGTQSPGKKSPNKKNRLRVRYSQPVQRSTSTSYLHRLSLSRSRQATGSLGEQFLDDLAAVGNLHRAVVLAGVG